jgi:hypothetical protein
MSDVFEKMNEAIYCDDFFTSANRLLEFVDLALREKNRRRIVDAFYEQLLRYAWTDYILEQQEKNYYICEGRSALSKYVLLSVYPQDTPTKSLRNIQKTAEYMIGSFTSPVGEHIKMKVVEDILKYLDLKYDFSKKIFKDCKALFAIIDVTKKLYDSECMIAPNDDDKLTFRFFLYCMTKEVGISPEAVLFHELGHAIHARYTGDINIFPKDIILPKDMMKLCGWEIAMISPQKQQEVLTEVLADVLSIGLMLESPFEKYASFTSIQVEDKRECKKMVESMLSSI